MPYTLSGAVTRLQAIAGALDGIKAAPDAPTESSRVFPFAISYPRAVNATPVTGGITRRLNTLVTEIHCARVLLPVAVPQATAYGDAFPAAVWDDPTLAGNCNHVNAVRGEFVTFEYAGVTTIGWSFEIDVKMED
jgi:hypothetical protein